MPSSYTCLYYHIIFGTKERRPQITIDLRPRLYDYMGGTISHEKGRHLGIGGMSDHVHLLAALSAQIALSDLMRVLKTNSSKWVHETFPGHKDFRWQDGFAAFTVSLSNIDDVKRYLANQESHHSDISDDTGSITTNDTSGADGMSVAPPGLPTVFDPYGGSRPRLLTAALTGLCCLETF